MVKPKKKTPWWKNLDNVDAASSQAPKTELAKINPAEKTSTVENPPFVPDPTTKPMSLLSSDFEGSAHVSSESESQLEFPYGINISKPDKDICTGNEPMLDGMGSAQHLLDEMHKLNVNNPPFVQNPMTQPPKLPASDIEGNAQVSSKVQSLFEFSHGMNTSSKPAKDTHIVNEPMLDCMGSAQHLLDKMHKLNVNNPPFVQNPMTQPPKLPASDIGGNAQVSSEVRSPFEFSHDMNTSSKPAKDTHTANEPMLGYIGGTERIDTLLSLNISSPSRDPNLVYGLSSNKRKIVGRGLLTTRNYENNPIKKILPGGKYDVKIGNEFSSNCQDGDFTSNEDLDKRVVEVAKQLLLTSNEDIQDENPDCAINDISVEYLKLYQETSPENYDFAMNIMAHIEFLNDSSWTTTVSYLDENVKRIVTHIWNDLYIAFNYNMKLQEFNRNMVLKLMMDFNQWSINQKFEFELFLRYSILMCQLGVVARQSISKDAAFCAIYLLRDRMKVLTFENLVQYMFDVALKDYAKRQYKV